jgi:hypothetical protein
MPAAAPRPMNGARAKASAPNISPTTSSQMTKPMAA